MLSTQQPYTAHVYQDPAVTHPAPSCTDTQAPGCLQFSVLPSGDAWGRPDLKEPFQFFCSLQCFCFFFFPTGPKGWHQRYSLAVLCFSCDLRSWHQGTARQSPADHRGRERLSLGGIKQTEQNKKNTNTKTQKLLKKRSFFKWTFIQSPTQRHQKDGNSFGFLLPATWDTQKGQSCCFSLAHRCGQWPGLKTWKLRAQSVRQLPAAPPHTRGGT